MPERRLSFDLVFESDRSDAELAVDVTHAVISQVPEPLLEASWRPATAARVDPRPRQAASRPTASSIHCWVPGRELPRRGSVLNDGRTMAGRGESWYGSWYGPVRRWLDRGCILNEEIIEPPNFDDQPGRTRVTFFVTAVTADVRLLIPAGSIGHWCVLDSLESTRPDIYATKVLWWEAKRTDDGEVAHLAAGLQVERCTLPA